MERGKGDPCPPTRLRLSKSSYAAILLRSPRRLLRADSGSVARRGIGPRDCPVFVKAAQIPHSWFLQRGWPALARIEQAPATPSVESVAKRSRRRWRAHDRIRRAGPLVLAGIEQAPQPSGPPPPAGERSGRPSRVRRSVCPWASRRRPAAGPRGRASEPFEGSAERPISPDWGDVNHPWCEQACRVKNSRPEVIS